MSLPRDRCTLPTGSRSLTAEGGGQNQSQAWGYVWWWWVGLQIKSKHVFEENQHHERGSPNSTDLTPKTRVTVRKRRLSKNTYVINSLRWTIADYIYEIGTAYYGK